MKKRSFNITCLVVVALAVNFRCSKNMGIRPFEYQFVAGVDIYPLKKTYSLSDTIWIESDLPTKFLFDAISGQSINADTTKVIFRAIYNEIGTSITNPPNGFCQLISSNGNIVQRSEAQWFTGGDLEYGCGQPDFKCRIGFKPNYKGSFALLLMHEDLLGNCTGKVKRLFAKTSFKYKNVDLNRDVFDSLSQNDKGGDGGAFYINKINSREGFIIRVQ